MSRLVVFGCSNTEGQGLANKAEERWSTHLGKFLNREVVNKGVRGGSNKLIAHSIAKFKFDPQDLVIIQWTYIDRTTVLNSKTEYTHLLPAKINVKNSTARSYYKDFHTRYDSKFTNSVFMDFTIDLLLEQNIEFKQLKVSPQDELNNRHRKVNRLPFYHSEISATFPKALDGLHMGAQGNLMLAKRIHKNKMGPEYII